MSDSAMDAQSFDILIYSLQAQLTYNWGEKALLKLHDVLNMLAVLCWAAFIATLMWPMQPIAHRLDTPASLDGVDSIQKLPDSRRHGHHPAPFLILDSVQSAHHSA